jgi:hypothetical protein
MQKSDGDLTLGTARIGARVRCVRVPNIRLWQDAHTDKEFFIPRVSQLYTVRGNVIALFRRGILLKEINNPDVSVLFSSGDHIVGEPFFTYENFNFVGFTP